MVWWSLSLENSTLKNQQESRCSSVGKRVWLKGGANRWKANALLTVDSGGMEGRGSEDSSKHWPSVLHVLVSWRRGCRLTESAMSSVMPSHTALYTTPTPPLNECLTTPSETTPRAWWSPFRQAERRCLEGRRQREMATPTSHRKPSSRSEELSADTHTPRCSNSKH